MKTSAEYIGNELEIFKEATTWKKYFSQIMRNYIRGNVLEVGAGIGGTTQFLWNERCESWTCLEPDPALAKELGESIAAEKDKHRCEVKTCLLGDLPEGESYDTILYIDVLEHIEDDEDEVKRAIRRLSEGGSLIVLSPAHQWLYSEFDKSIGHYRRYTKASLKKLTPSGAKLADIRYLDSVGMFASIANRVLLRQSLPNRKQIRFWDRKMIPVSRVLDPVLGYAVGKSTLAVWNRTA